MTIFNYVPLSEARKVALYILFFTFGDSLSKRAIVVICPFTGSIFSQLAGSDNFVYLQNENAVSLMFLTLKFKNKTYFTLFVPNATSSLICIFVDDGWKYSFNMEKYCCDWLFEAHNGCVLADMQETLDKCFTKKIGTHSLYCG